MYLPPPRVFKPPRLASSKAGNLVAPFLFSSIRVTAPSLDPTVFDKSEPVRSLSSRRSSPRFLSFIFVFSYSRSFRLRTALRLRVQVFACVDSASNPIACPSSLFRHRRPGPASLRPRVSISDSRPASVLPTRTHRVTLTGFAPYTAHHPLAFSVFTIVTAWPS
jgi:hypothetical protein